MIFVPQSPKCVPYLFDLIFPLISMLTNKTKAEEYVGARPGYEMELLFA